MQKITPCLWFDTEGEEAAKFYTSVFKNSRILDISRYGEAGPRPAGTVMTVTFELDGQEFVALNGGPEFKFNEAVSFQVSCETQEEVDEYWKLLSEDGEEGPCGWLKDRYGVSWQVVPTSRCARSTYLPFSRRLIRREARSGGAVTGPCPQDTLAMPEVAEQDT
jgi:predicted 3-demethylubiquinone-9 3-methyltransferase (glyoxalase superfamily)